MTTDDPIAIDNDKIKKQLKAIGKENSSSRVANKNISDIDGNAYSVVQIGSQLWMSENLRTTKYNDGTDIQLLTNGDWDWNFPSSAFYSWPNDDKATYGGTYGALYNWHAVNTGKLCPKGSHVPTQEEWATLIHYLDADVQDYSIFSKVAGDKMRESGTQYWPSPNDATNESGFTALPAGHYWGSNVGFGNFGGWWSATEVNDPSYGWYVFIAGDGGYNYEATMAGAHKSEGESCRCVLDSEENLHGATGSGHFESENGLRVFTHSARINPNGTVNGHFDLNRKGAIHVDGSVIALNVDGNVAYFAGVIETSNSENQAWLPGQFVIWSTKDNGEGETSPPDQITFMYTELEWTEDWVKSLTKNEFRMPYYDIDLGNIQVH